jgi:3-isopropylmalate dehydrogenase
VRPEQGLLALRKQLNVYANLRPVKPHPATLKHSAIKAEVLQGVDLVVVRELTGGSYFGRKERHADRAVDVCEYTVEEIQRVARHAFRLARTRRGKVTSVDKANVLETFQFWKDVVTEVHAQYPDVELQHMYVDNAAMQLVKAPKAFDVVVTGNMFGDILSDEAAMLTGSIGMLPSASLDKNGKGLYEPSHGSAPDIAGKGVANPLATILSAAMMLRFTLNQPAAADRIDTAVKAVLAAGLRTPDIWSEGTTQVGTREMGDAVVAAVLGQSAGKTITKTT